MQWRMLGRRGRHASWTIVGDPSQSSWPDAVETDAARDAALGRAKHGVLVREHRLPQPAENFELAAQ